MSVLYIRHKNGNFVPIRSLKGDDGKSAYEQAQDGGYTGTEAEFIALLNGLTASEDANHYADLNNPHNVTAEQVGLGNVDNTSDADKPISDAVNAELLKIINFLTSHTSLPNAHGINTTSIGAIPSEYTVVANLNHELKAGGGKVRVCAYTSQDTINTPFELGETEYAHGLVITNAYTEDYATQICIPSGDDHIYIRRKSGTNITLWEKMCNIGDVPKVSEIKTYIGTGTSGSANPCHVTFDAPPKFVVIMAPNASYVGFFISGVNQYLVASANGFSTSGNECTWTDNTLYWRTLSNSQYYQLNAGTQKYTCYVSY